MISWQAALVFAAEAVSHAFELACRYSCPKMRYKCTEGVSKPLLVMMRAASSRAAQSRRQHPGIQVLSSSEAGSNGSSSHSQPAARSSFNFPPPPRAAKQQQQQHGVAATAAWKVAGSIGGKGEQQPHYVIVHRGRADMGDAWGDAGNQLLQHSLRPKVCALIERLQETARQGVC